MWTGDHWLWPDHLCLIQVFLAFFFFMACKLIRLVWTARYSCCCCVFTPWPMARWREPTKNWNLPSNISLPLTPLHGVITIQGQYMPQLSHQFWYRCIPFWGVSRLAVPLVSSAGGKSIHAAVTYASSPSCSDEALKCAHLSNSIKLPNSEICCI